MLPLSAQKKEGINFIASQPFEEVLKVAKAQKKNIFVDCFATWCGPCKLLAQKTFPQKEVGDFFNSRFICIQYDVEKGDGIGFYKNYQSNIPGLPTMLLINPEGKVIHAIVGFREPKALIDDISKSLKGKTLSMLEKQYQDGERSIDFMKEYLAALKSAYKKKEMETVTKAYLNELPVEALLDRDIWNMAKDYISNPYASDYQFVINNSYKIRFPMKESSLLLDRQLTRGMEKAINHLLPELEQKEVGEATLDSMKILKRLLYKNELLNSTMWLGKLEIAKLKREDRPVDLYQYLKFAKTLHLYNTDQMYLKGLYQYLANHIADKTIWADCLQDLIELQQQENTSSLPTNFYDLIADLHQKLGHRDESKTAQEQYEKLQLINNEKIKQFYEIFKK